jgi:hypothetical protein
VIFSFEGGNRNQPGQEKTRLEKCDRKTEHEKAGGPEECSLKHCPLFR